MIPRYGEWARKYADRGLVVIGVHTPETDKEADPQQLSAYVQGRRITWPVVVDPYFEAWRRYAIEAWPTILLIDRDGVLREVYVGEDHAGEIEYEIKHLLG